MWRDSSVEEKWAESFFSLYNDRDNLFFFFFYFF